MAGNSDELPTGKRPRKPTEKAKLLGTVFLPHRPATKREPILMTNLPAEAHSGGAKKPAKVVGQSTRSSDELYLHTLSAARVDKASMNQKKANEVCEFL